MASKYIGKTVQYKRQGSRHGWLGTIVDMTGDRVMIEFDNGVEQEYSFSAIAKPDSDVDPDSHYAYLVIQDNPPLQPQAQKASARPLPKKSWLIVNMQTGTIVGVETSKDEAELFADEQAQDSKDHTTFTVFKPHSSFAIKRPLVERLLAKIK